VIIHVDMDAFYASVEIRDRPELTEEPVIVGGTPESRGVVAAANYVARRYGVHSAMPASRALQLCPQAIILPVRMAYYADVSRAIRAIFHQYTPIVEPLSLDEAFLDCTASEALFGTSADIGRQIKLAILDQLGLVASVGVAPNKFLAKLASDLDKPDGFVVVEPHGVQGFLDPLPVERLWGVGRVARLRLARVGIQTVAQLRSSSPEVLEALFGRAGTHLWQLARGIDDRPVVPDHGAKSISHETTFATDIADRDVLRARLMELTEQVARRLRRQGLEARTVQVKLRRSDFQTITRAHTLATPTDITEEIWKVADRLMKGGLGAAARPLRLIGVGVSGLDKEVPRQTVLFEDDPRTRGRRLDAAIDGINGRFGQRMLRRATELKR